MNLPSSSVKTAENNPNNPLRLYGDGFDWVVLHTRPRCEKKVEEFCCRNGFPVYLPLQKKVHRYGARNRPFWSPLFPGYVFCVATQVQKSTLKQNQHVANLLQVYDPAKLVCQLAQIQHAIGAGDVITVLPYLETGKPVVVSGGPFKGLEGIVERVKGKERIIINVDMIQQSIAVEVDSCYLRPA